METTGVEMCETFRRSDSPSTVATPPCGVSPPCDQLTPKSIDGTKPQLSGTTEGNFIPTTPWGIHRVILLVIYCLTSFFTGCVYWGWDGIQDLMYKSGAFSDSCGGDNTETPPIPVGNGFYTDCPARQQAINNMYTVAFVCHFVFSAMAGVILDVASPKACFLVGQLSGLIGWCLLAFSSESFNAYYAAAAFMGISADPGYLPLLSVANLFPGNESLVMSILGSVRSCSFAMPVILAAIYVNRDVYTTSDFWKFCIGYAGIAIGFSIVVGLCLIPMKAFPKQTSETERVVQLAEEMEESQEVAETTKDEPVMSFWKTASQPEYLLIVPLFCLTLVRSEFYTKSNKNQLVTTSGSNVLQMYSIMNILSFLPGPVMGKLTDRFGILFVIVLLNSCGIGMYTFLMPDSIVCKGISVMFYFVYTSFVLSNLYCYVGVTFNVAHFGKLTGLASMVAGLWTLTSLGWYKLSTETLRSIYPLNFLPVDGIMLVYGGIIYVLWYQLYRLKKKKDMQKALEVKGCVV